MKNTRLEVVQDWTPRALPGGKFCSPACGGHCKRSDYDAAHKAAAALAARLGDGWKPRVWENLGWHWEVANVQGEGIEQNGIIVRRRDHGDFSAEFCSAATMCRHVTQFFATAKTPEDAIGSVRQDVRTYIARLNEVLQATI